MTSNSLADLSDAQTVVPCPFASHAGLRACGFDFVAVIGVKELLPADVESRREITHVHQALFFEFLQDLRIHLARDFAAIRDRCGPALLRRQRAVEINLLRPARHVRALIMIENHFVGRVRSGLVDFADYAFARKVAILGEEF